MRFFVSFVFFFSVIAVAHSQENPKDLYRQGIQSFQQKNLDTAKEKFESALSLAPNNPLILYNLGLVYFELEQRGLALGMWRKALSIYPTFTEGRKALSYALEQTKGGQLANPSNWEKFRFNVLMRVSFEMLLLISCFLMGVSGYLLIRYFAHRKRSYKNEEPLPGFPTLGTVFFLLCFLSLGLIGCKVYDFLNPRATVIVDSLMVKSGPNDESSTLFELFEGFEVIIKKTHDDWVQVSYPGGLTGWVLKSSLYATSRSNPW